LKFLLNKIFEKKKKNQYLIPWQEFKTVLKPLFIAITRNPAKRPVLLATS
jgi:hypothetical protein